MSIKSKFLAGLLAVGMSTGGAFAAVIDLGFSLDDSGSVGPTNFNTTRVALSNALSNIPTSGGNQYRIAVNKFGSSVTTVVPPTIVTAGNIAAIQTAVATTAFTSGGSTQTQLAISNLQSLFVNAGGLNETSLFNITTDGFPSNQSAAETAALNAFNAGVDGISFELIGNPGSSATENTRRLSALGTNGDTDAASAIITGDVNALPDPLNVGFVLTVTDFAGYSAAIDAKIQQIIVTTNPVPLPAGLPLLLVGIGAFGVMRRRGKTA